MPARTLVIFSDLDGTLLDHRTYDFAPARPALEALEKYGVPLILATSKTAAELEPLQREIGLSHPAIVENGGGAVVPEGYFAAAGQADEPPAGAVPHACILEKLASLPRAMRDNFSGFSDWSAAGVAERTGLDIASARKAKRREWSEPGLWTGDEAALEAFGQCLRDTGLTLARGGRFLQVMGDTDKARSMAWLAGRFAAMWGRRPLCAALGDAPNDAGMLDAADFGFIIPNPGGTAIPPLKGEASGKVKRIDAAGPSGWNRAVLDLLSRLQAGG